MNIEENLILIKDEDKTDKIIYCENSNGKCKITFDNNKTYTYNHANVKWIRHPIEINADSNLSRSSFKSTPGVLIFTCM